METNKLSEVTRMPEVTITGLLDMQVCVPSNWTDAKVKSFANSRNPCGTSMGWQIRKTGSKLLGEDLERNPCLDREGFVHIMLDA